MILRRINRSGPEKIFISVKNSYATASLTDGQAVVWDYGTDADGVSVTKPTDASKAGGGHFGSAFAGIATQTIAAGDYGLIQIYGYHSSARVRTLTAGKPAIAAGTALSSISAIFALESYKGSAATTSTATQHLFHPAAFAMAAQASFTTKTIAVFIKAL